MTRMSQEVCSLIGDFGSGTTKFGFGGDDYPRAVFSTLVGRTKYTFMMIGCYDKFKYIGDEAVSKRGMLTLSHPIHYEGVLDKEDIESLFHHSFYNEVKCAPEEHPDVFVLPLDNERQNRCSVMKRLITELLFETFNSPGIYLDESGLMPLYAAGRVSGSVFHVGYRLTQFASNVQTSQSAKMSLGGADCIEALRSILNSRGYSFHESGDLYTVRGVFEGKNVSSTHPTILGLDRRQLSKDVRLIGRRFSIKPPTFLDVYINRNNLTEFQYTLPDDTIITLNRERYIPMEVLFQPKLFGLNLPSLSSFLTKHHHVESSSQNNEIILAGGMTLVKNFAERLNFEIKYQASNASEHNLHILEDVSAKYSNWIGASLISELNTLRSSMQTKEEYDERGCDYIYNFSPDPAEFHVNH